MKIISFLKRFPTEEACKKHFLQQRNKLGITCKRCQDKTKHYWLEAKNKWMCSQCESVTCMKAGTIMERSKLPIQTWYLCMHLMTSVKKPFSALEMQRQLECKYYEPVLNMMHKIRIALGKRDDNYKLFGHVEIDDAFFTSVNPVEKDRLGNPIGVVKESKRGRGTTKSTVLVMAESTPVSQPKYKHSKKRALGHIKMTKMDDLSGAGINYVVSKSINEESHVISDKYSSYSGLKDLVASHTRVVVKPKDAMSTLPWVHTIISNAKRQILGVHHSVTNGYLQNYLNEFCYKLNRRNIEGDLFDNVLALAIEDTWY